MEERIVAFMPMSVHSSTALTIASSYSSAAARSIARCPPPRCWTGETSAEIVIRAPAQLLFEAYADIERMSQWSPMLERVELVDPIAKRSQWSLRVPRPLSRIVSAAGMGRLVRWEAEHEVQEPRLLRWRSLSACPQRATPVPFLCICRSFAMSSPSSSSSSARLTAMLHVHICCIAPLAPLAPSLLLLSQPVCFLAPDVCVARRRWCAKLGRGDL